MTKALDLSLPHKVADLSQADFGGKEMQLSEREIEGIQRKAENIKNKGDAEILAEIAALKDAIKKDRRAYEKQISAIKAMRPMMNKEQRARLDRIIALIEE